MAILVATLNFDHSHLINTDEELTTNNEGHAHPLLADSTGNLVLGVINNHTHVIDSVDSIRTTDEDVVINAEGK
jgi:hypothetical protein